MSLKSTVTGNIRRVLRNSSRIAVSRNLAVFANLASCFVYWILYCLTKERGEVREGETNREGESLGEKEGEREHASERERGERERKRE